MSVSSEIKSPTQIDVEKVLFAKNPSLAKAVPGFFISLFAIWIVSMLTTQEKCYRVAPSHD